MSTVVHASNPDTPTPATTVLQCSGNLNLPKSRDENDTELELDLESLGLEDREVPPDKIVKMEKIGSGGFKE